MWFVFWWCVGARWCPTLPFPGGSSTMGAGGLSFRVRDGSGRCLPAMTTETCGGVVWCACGCCSLWGVALWCCGWLWSYRPPAAVCSGVGGGLVVVCIVDAGLCSVRGPPLVWGGWCSPCCSVPPLVPLVWGVGVGVCVCVGLLVPVGFGRCRSSTSGLSTQWSAGGLPAARGAAAETWS